MAVPSTTSTKQTGPRAVDSGPIPQPDDRPAADIAAELERRLGRRVRILHIGNIANNAYLNARMLNEAGFDCDVLCYDYYHIMGCPEWEDADIRQPIGDHFAPDWAHIDLRGFARPDWFAQGPFELAASYLAARRCGDGARARRLRADLASIPPGGGTIQRPFARRVFSRLEREWLVRTAAMRDVIRQGFRATLRAVARQLHPIRFVRLFMQARILIERLALRVIRGAWGAASWIGRRRGIGRALPQSWQRWWWKQSCRLEGWRAHLDAMRRRVPRVPDFAWFGEGDVDAADDASLARRFRRHFPGRNDALAAADLVPYASVLPRWRDLLTHYDVVVGYATDGIYPLLCGHRPYFAFEHGTIRSIPFDETAQGRLCALTYREADHVFITNCDNIVAAQRLGLPRYGFLPHPVNETFRDEDDAADLRRRVCAELDADFLVFHPARQHWEPDERNPNWEKGNDHLIRGMAAFIHATGARAGAVFVDWGKTVAESKALLEELGITNRVKWIDPLPNRAMIRCVSACDVVADQFHLGAFGSLTPKALMCGKPCLLFLDEARHRWCFPELPPVINARNPDEVEAGLTRLHGDRAWRDDLSRAGCAWYRRYHSNEIIGRTMAAAVERALDPSASPASDEIAGEDTSHRT